MKFFPSVSLIVLTAAGALALTGCTNSEQDSTRTPASTTAAASSMASSSDAAQTPVSFKDAVVRAMAQGKDMTSIFGTLVNNTEEPVTITGFETSLDAPMNQIHEVVNGVMQEKAGGLTLAPGESHELAPGGDHFMVMGVSNPVAAGDTVEVTLLLSDGTTVSAGEVPVREIGAGDENYGDISGGAEMSETMSGMSGMGH